VLVAMPFALRGNERAHYWGVALHEARASPALGSGAGTFVDWWLRNRPVPQSALEAHSLYLETLAELGPVGLAILIAALGVSLMAAWHLRRDRFGPPLLAALVVFDIAAAADFHWDLAAVTAPVFVLGAAAAVHADAPSGVVRPRVAVPALLALTLAATLALAGNAAIEARNGAQAVRFAPYSAQAWELLGDARRANDDLAGAAAAYRHATRLDPNDWSVWVSLASVERGEPRRSALAEAARLNPLGGGAR
jgi:tetratricopeptide (TPR) repeat protein